MQALNVPVTNMTALKKSPAKVIKEAAAAKNGVYIFNRDHPAAVLMTAHDYEKLIAKLDELEDELLDLQVEQTAAKRIDHQHKAYSEEEVFGKDGLADVKIEDDDGWE
ncbi:MAG: type II toxin-antitoxin system Phd/YefM family antitoxin [Lactobacillus sp.]|jgi:PHD/YefM family antitoxin component YafN of YafNO toxin-antitoxin module|nr:type II toxin-antitoxin system Phd/YefM family antitoxin [Lactobacillus sp.]MCH3906443.1 type II toxin-antitoxin system Phd/YefM family antitoxin [Lactobacillus sp.]MCH3989981.1 type II toxin-antitoxin system Phd/YefM family antitoxin [Lactobacillus sp.]MCH4069305.1 type II toxin-antitoxin system Phd/YefM family antitoxin [Lactobacillus sp.]MCI1303708.1 type II toxin-antitoxin system Phd/YefM family antitoxin [Lactobacillus sp.]